MPGLPSMLAPITVKLDQLLLDANNPRFSELGEEMNPVPESRFSDDSVQTAAFEKMKSGLFDVAELRDTIKTIGFLPMDRMVVRKWAGPPSSKERFVVIEGNRRLSALRWLIDLNGSGKETLSEEQLQNFSNIECLLLNEELAPKSATLILPGLRHVSGIKEWGAYQKAKAVHALRKSGLSSQDAAQSLGLSVRSANSSYRCFLALEQMKKDEEFGERADARMYSYFEEVFKRASLRTWLGWSDETEGFSNEERRIEFYSWIVPNEIEGVGPKLPESKSVRELSELINDEGAMTILRGPNGSLSRALARYEVDHPEDWYPKVTGATSAVKSLTPEVLRNLDENTINSLIELREKITQALKDRDSLLAQTV